MRSCIILFLKKLSMHNSWFSLRNCKIWVLKYSLLCTHFLFWDFLTFFPISVSALFWWYISFCLWEVPQSSFNFSFSHVFRITFKMLFNSGIFQIAGYFVILLLIPSVSLKCFEGASPIIGIQKSFKSGALQFFWTLFLYSNQWHRIHCLIIRAVINHPACA